jgi:hypothetical protein
MAARLLMVTASFDGEPRSGYTPWTRRAGPRWPVGFALRLLLHSAAIVALATGCAYPYYSYPYGYYPYGYGYYPYGYSGYGPTVVGTEAPTTLQAPAIQREVVYPHGKYVLYGDGVNQPWQWAWVPAAPAPPSPTPAERPRP